MNKFCLSETIRERLYEAERETETHQRVMTLNPKVMDTWEYRDRKGFELGNIYQLAESIRTVGQAQPIIIVERSKEFKPKHRPDVQYVVIAGYRRWLACKLYDIPIQAIVKTLNFDEALSCMISENEKEDVSDYSKGLFYKNVLMSEKITQEALAKNLGIPKARLSHFLAFTQVPAVLWEQVKDMSRVSSHTASFIRSLLNKGDEYLPILLELAPDIAKGCGAKRLQKHIEKSMDTNTSNKNTPIIQVRYHNKPLLKISQGRISLGKTLTTHPEIDTLYQGFEKLVTDFAKTQLEKS